jgi:hypothetical protein
MGEGRSLWRSHSGYYGALIDRSGSKCRRRQKKWAQGDGGSRQKLAFALRRWICPTFPARRGGHRHGGPKIDKRRSGMQQWNKGQRRKKAATWEGFRCILSDIQEDLMTGDRNVKSVPATGLWRVNDWVVWRGRLPPKWSNDAQRRALGKEKSVHL